MKNVYAWFAGFFEGEGNIRLASKNVRYNTRWGPRVYAIPVLDICQVNIEPLEKAFKIFPFAKIYGPYQYSANKQPHYKFTISGREKCECVYTLIKGLLSKRRKEQFIKTFQDHDNLNNRPKFRTGPTRILTREEFLRLKDKTNTEIAKLVGCADSTICRYRKEFNENPSLGS